MRDMINITIVEYQGFPTRLYLLKKEDSNYKAREIFKKEAIEILKEYNNPTCQFHIENVVMKLLDDEKSKLFD